MSLIISLTSSNPTESLTKFSLIPKSFFSFLDNLWCVVVSGWVINVFESPKLFEISIRFNLFKNLKEVFFLIFLVKLIQSLILCLHLSFVFLLRKIEKNFHQMDNRFC